MPSIELVESTVSQEQARKLIEGWADKKNLAPLEFIKEGQVYYPYYYGETLTTIKRIFPLPPRELIHRWLLDAITGRPFMLPGILKGIPYHVRRSKKILEPVIDLQGAAENIKDQLPRFIMRYYKYFFTPSIATRNISLLYVNVWLYSFLSNGGIASFLGVNSWSGNIMELEDERVSSYK